MRPLTYSRLPSSSSESTSFINFFNINHTDGSRESSTLINSDGTLTACFRSNSDWAGRQYDILYLVAFDNTGNITKIKGFELTGSQIALSQYTDCVLRRNAGYLTLAGTATINNPLYASVMFIQLNASSWDIDRKFDYSGDKCDIQLKDIQVVDDRTYAMLATTTCYDCNGQSFGANNPSMLVTSFDVSGNAEQRFGICATDRNDILRAGGLGVLGKNSYILTSSENDGGTLIAKMDDGNLTWSVESKYPVTASTPVLASDGSLFILGSVYRMITSKSQKGQDPAVVKFDLATAQVTRVIAIGNTSNNDFNNQFVSGYVNSDDIYVVGGNAGEYSGQAISATCDTDLRLSWLSTWNIQPVGGEESMSFLSSVHGLGGSIVQTGYTCGELSLNCRAIVSYFPENDNMEKCHNISLESPTLYDITHDVNFTPVSMIVKSNDVFNISDLAIRINNSVDLSQEVICQAEIPQSTSIAPIAPSTMPFDSTPEPYTTASPNTPQTVTDIVIALIACLVAGSVIVALFATKKLRCPQKSIFTETTSNSMDQPLRGENPDGDDGELVVN